MTHWLINPALSVLVALTIAASTFADDAHWSFQPPQRPEPPQVKNAGWAENPVDRFILARLESQGLAPVSPADRVTLIRRVTFDLTGLPPTPDEVDAFVNDPSPNAYEALVHRLLASPAYGERWAQHWLDLARFAETDGFEHDKVRDEAWRYRDWVIDALNRDLPYDSFLRQQIAGDELHPDDERVAIATGFLLAGQDMPDINSQELRRHEKLNDMVSTVGSAMLGLTVGCAQCHDHKYDPITQVDYYAMRAVFANTVFRKRDKLFPMVIDEPGRDVGPAHLMLRGDHRKPGEVVEPAVPVALNRSDARIEPPTDDASSSMRRAALARWLTRPDHPLTSRVIVNRLWQHHFGRGIVRTPSDFGTVGAEPTHPDLLDWLATELVRRGWSLKAMHKLMVTSATYQQASRPTSKGDDAWRNAVQADPDNRLLARMNRRRLSGEAIRDAMLACADRLNTERGGPSVRPPLPDEVVATLLRKDHWKVSEDGADHRRRSVYIFVRRNLRFPLFDAFDSPDTTTSCARRSRSTTAPQSLMLLNAELSLDAARGLAGAVLAEAGADDLGAQVERVYRRALGRAPSSAERESATAFVQSQAGAIRESDRDAKRVALPDDLPEDADPAAAAALVDLCLSVFNLNEFVYVD